MTWVPGFTPPPQNGLGTQVRVRICMPCVHMYAYLCICTHMHEHTQLHAHVYISCMAYSYRQMHAWQAWAYICMHGMHAYLCASSHVHLHPTSHRGWGMTEALTRWIPWASPRSTPHPTGRGGTTSPGEPFPWGRVWGGPLAPTIYICVLNSYILIFHFFWLQGARPFQLSFRLLPNACCLCIAEFSLPFTK